MTLTRLIGDIHGKVYDYQAHCISDFAGPTIQVGDFGIGFGQGDYWHESLNDFQAKGNHRFIRGNHDNPNQCKLMNGWISDGTVENDIMFIGGAWSIDNPNAPPGWYRRTAGVDWWPDEELGYSDFEKIIDVYNTVRPRVMITHDCPRSVSRKMFFESGLLTGPEYPNKTATALEIMWEIHEPEFWFFGHWHFTRREQIGKTVFQCIGELDYIDVEL
jgi:hypothetical protein